MADDKKDLEVPQAEAPAPTLTTQTCADEVNQIIDKYTAAGLRPLPVLAKILAKRGMGLLDQVRAAAADVIDQGLSKLDSPAKTGKK